MTDPIVRQAFIDRCLAAVTILCVIALLWFNSGGLFTWATNHRWQAGITAAVSLSAGLLLFRQLRERRMSRQYRTLREMGHSRRIARRMALVNTVKDEDAKQIMSGITYEPDQVNQAIVHSRQDLVLVIAYLEEATSSLRLMSWLLAVLTVLISIQLLVSMY